MLRFVTHLQLTLAFIFLTCLIFIARMRTWQAKAGGNVTRSLKFILSLFCFQIIFNYIHYPNDY